jgi:hypothetical protein
MPVAGLAMLLVDQARDLESVEQCNQVAGIAVEVRMILVAVAVDDEGVGGDFPAEAELAVAFRQHRALIGAARLQYPADLCDRRADDDRIAVIDDVEREDIIEIAVRIGQCGHHADRGLDRQRAPACLFGQMRDAGVAAVDRISLEAVRGEKQRVSANAAAEIERAFPAGVGHGAGEVHDEGFRVEPLGASVGGFPALVPGEMRGCGVVALHHRLRSPKRSGVTGCPPARPRAPGRISAG